MAESDKQYTPMLDDEAAGRGAARWLWDHWPDEGSVRERLTEEFASAAIDELSRIRKERTAGVLSAALDGAERSAEQLNVESFHGIVEIVQNADDLGATSVNIAFQRSGKSTRLFVSHDGDRVHLPNTLAMTLAFVSTKTEDPRTKGKFGIGLKTLGRLGSRLSVHSPPYHYSIEEGTLVLADPAPPIKGLFRATEDETLLELALHSGFDLREFHAWLSERGASWLIFLDAVRNVRLIDLRSGKILVDHRLRDIKTDNIEIKLTTGICPCERKRLREVGRRRTWTRYSIEQPVPDKLRRKHKATGSSTPLGVAVPSDNCTAPLYAGLPLEMPGDLPLALNAQFDPDTARRTVLDTPWNNWLFNRIGDLVGAAILSRFEEAPADGWSAVPLLKELQTREDEWLHTTAKRMIENIHDRLRSKLRISIDGVPRRLQSLVYEAASLEGLLDATDQQGLAPKLYAIPTELRDRKGRWREVLEEIGVSRRIDVGDALTIFDWSDEELGERPGNWYVRMLGAVLNEDLENSIYGLRCILTRDGRRFASSDIGSTVLIITRQDDDLAAHLHVSATIDSAFLARNETAQRVRSWLKEEGLLLTKVADDVLLELMSEWEDEPIQLSDHDVGDLRDALESVSAGEAEQLGGAIGDRVKVRGYRYESSRKVKQPVIPGYAYRPSALDKRRNSWAVAAGKTPGIEWVHGDYEELLKSNRTSRGAAAFFKLLGAEVAPRLLMNKEDQEYRQNKPANRIYRSTLPAVQLEELQNFPGNRASHLRHDTVARELNVVVRSIASERVSKVRRKRARALIKTLESAWDREYSEFTQASVVYSDYSWRQTGKITATWLAIAMNEPWLTNQSGKKKAPRELTVQTPRTIEVYGYDRSLFAYELDADDASHQLIAALGIEGDPRASGIVEELLALRDSESAHEAWDTSRPQALYTALSAHCPREAKADDRVDDLSVRQLRARFGQQHDRPGLVYVRGKWLPLPKVFRGPPIFGPYRAFVPRALQADALWQTLGVDEPRSGDCLEVLRELASSPLKQEDESVLLETYRRLSNLLDRIPGKMRLELTTTPLWSGTEWLSSRPIYAVHDRRVAEELALYVQVWRPPCDINTLGNLTEALGVTVLPESSFEPAGLVPAAVVTGQTLAPRFVSAVDQLRTYLAEHDDRCARGFNRWRYLSDAALMISKDLSVEVMIDGSRFEVPTDIHLGWEPLTIYMSSEEALADANVGGRIIASLFDLDESGKVTVGLAWEHAWRRAATDGSPGRSVYLVGAEQEEDPLPAVDDGKKAAGERSRERHKRRDHVSGSADTGAAADRPKTRELKSLGNLHPIVDAVDLGGTSGGVRVVERRGLKRSGKAPPTEKSKRHAASGALRGYTSEEREDLGFEVMAREVMNRFGTDLSDCRSQQGVGADAIDSAGRYFELKAHECDMPNMEPLTANEAEQALRQRRNYYLVVVSGLEEGYQERVIFISDPMYVLDLTRSSNVVLAGIRTALNPAPDGKK